MKKLLAVLLLVASPVLLRSQNASFSTNALDYVDFGTVNIEASVGVARHWSLNAGARYNPFSFGEGDGEILRRQQTYSVGARYWPWHIYAGWWLSGKAQYQEFNTGGITSRRTSQGDRYGSSLSAGYSYLLSSHLNLDIGIGMWAGYEKYVTYSCQHCGTVVDDGEKFFFLPNDMMLSLTYIF